LSVSTFSGLYQVEGPNRRLPIRIIRFDFEQKGEKKKEKEVVVKKLRLLEPQNQRGILDVVRILGLKP